MSSLHLIVEYCWYLAGVDLVGVTSPRKSSPEIAGRRREWRESTRHTTASLSSQGSDPLHPSGKLPQAREMSLKLTAISGSEHPPRLTRSSRRADASLREETARGEGDSGVLSMTRSKREQRRKGRSERRDDREVLVHPPHQGESDNASMAGEDMPPDPYSPLPLALIVSIPIENSSSTNEYASVSDTSSEVSDQLITGQGQVGGKDMVEGECEGDSSKESNASSGEETHSESSQGDSDREGLLESGGTRGEFDTHSCSSGGESATDGEGGARETVRTQRLRADVKIAQSQKPGKKSGKSIPDTKKSGRRSEHTPSGGEAVGHVPRKRVAKRGKKGKKRDEKHACIKYLLELDRKLWEEGHSEKMGKAQWESYHLLRSRDQQAIFCSPVTDEIAPGYSAVISQPMDFSQMREKIEEGAYPSLEQLYQDFVLMCQNAMTYNKPTTYYYKAAKKIKESGVKVLDKMARDTLKSQERREVPRSPPGPDGSLLEERREGIGPLLVSIDRSLLLNIHSPKRAPVPVLLSETPHTTTPHEPSPDSTPTASTAPTNTTNSRKSPETPQSITQHTTDTVGRVPVDNTIPDTTLLPLPSSFSQKSSRVAVADSRAAEPATHPTGSRPIASKGQGRNLEKKQKKLKRRREIDKQKFYNNGTQARRIYRGSLAPIRPLNYGSFSSFAPSYDSSFANINSQETDRLSSLLGHRDIRDDDSLLCSSKPCTLLACHIVHFLLLSKPYSSRSEKCN